jgi:preprotein translocase subunit SecE
MIFRKKKDKKQEELGELEEAKPKKEKLKKEKPKKEKLKKVKKEKTKRNIFSRVFSTIVLFIRQVIDEIKKVITPTKQEVITYTGVVLVFVLVLMGFITAFDYGVGQGITLIFG